MRNQTCRNIDKVVFAIVSPSLSSKRNGMVAFSLFLFISTLLVQPHCSSSSTQPPSPLPINNNFDPDIDFFGDAHAVGDGVGLTLPSKSSSGLLLRRTPVTFSGGDSLSAEFTFSISPSSAGAGLILILVPGDFSDSFPGNDSYGLSQKHSNNYVAVEFDTSKDDNFNDPNDNHVGIDVGSLISVAIANVSDSNIDLNSGEKLTAWVDYVAASKNLEVRLCKFDEKAKPPANPIVTHSIDLGKFWSGERVFIGLSSSNNGDSVQVVSVYSWKVSLRNVEKSLHSAPADPGCDNGDEKVALDEAMEKNKGRTLSVLAGLIFGTGCLALVSFVVLVMWAIFFQRREDESLGIGKILDNPAEIKYERIDVSVDKNNKVDAN